MTARPGTPMRLVFPTARAVAFRGWSSKIASSPKKESTGKLASTNSSPPEPRMTSTAPDSTM